MCGGCVQTALEDGGPVVVTDEMLRVADLVHEVYQRPWGAAGGPMHIYLDDFNLDDVWFTDEARSKVIGWCGEYRTDEHRGFGDDDESLILAVFDALRPMSEVERNLAVAFDGMVTRVAAGTTVYGIR